MKWINLKNNKCPQCNKDWAFDLTAVDGFLAHGCGFKIGENRYSQIVTSQVTRQLEQELEKEQEVSFDG